MNYSSGEEEEGKWDQRLETGIGGKKGVWCFQKWDSFN